MVRTGNVIQLLKYAVVGLAGTLCHYLVLLVLVELNLAGVLAATSCGFVVGALVNHGLNRQFVFAASGRSYRESGLRFMVIAVLGFLLNFVIMGALLHGLGVNYLIAQVVATGVVFMVSFTANKSWTFSAIRGKNGKADDNRSRIQ
ncbi:MAG: GtrA family protein [Halomonadaceae bacterium]|nr:MAG: GtrA family protein [Halomonadaceae bacterium]